MKERKAIATRHVEICDYERRISIRVAVLKRALSQEIGDRVNSIVKRVERALHSGTDQSLLEQSVIIFVIINMKNSFLVRIHSRIP